MADPVWVHGVRSNPLHAPPPPVFRYPMKTFMGNFKIMTRACMPRHARTCLFQTLSLYMIMHVFNKLSFSLPSIHVHVCPFVCLCMNIHVSVCTYVCMCVCVRARACVRAYVLVPCADPVFWPSGLDPPPPPPPPPA